MGMITSTSPEQSFPALVVAPGHLQDFQLSVKVWKVVQHHKTIHQSPVQRSQEKQIRVKSTVPTKSTSSVPGYNTRDLNFLSPPIGKDSKLLQWDRVFDSNLREKVTQPEMEWHRAESQHRKSKLFLYIFEYGVWD